MWWLLACSDDPRQGDVFDPASVELPAPADLPAVEGPPPVLEMWSEPGDVDSVARFDDRRRPEILVLLARYVYGRPGPQGPPPPLPEVRVASVEPAVEVLGGDVVLERIHVEAAGLGFVVDWFHPPAYSGPIPVFLALEKCGLHSLIDDGRLPLPTAFVHPDCEGGATEAGRGSRASEWSLRRVVEAGASVAAIHESELAPDDADEPAPIDVLAGDDDEDGAAWGTVARWSFGLRIAGAALREHVDGVDPERIVVFGHSRRGKAALWAAATDPDLPIVWAHQSGTGGAKLTRSLLGEPVGAVVQLFPHWFAPDFAAFAGAETRLPVDQHALLGAIAPRTAWLTDGDEDLWAGPEGVAQAVEHSVPAFELTAGRAPDHGIRPGDHSVVDLDWALALERLAALP